MIPTLAMGALPIPGQLTGSDILVRLLAVLLLIGINAFFVTAEFSIVSVRRSRIAQLVSDGDIQAKTVQSLHRSIDRLLSTTQLGITLSSLALGWIGESTMAVLLTHGIINLPLPQPLIQVLVHSISIPFAFFLIAYLQIVLGELCPKAIAMLYAEQLARFLGPPSLTIAQLFNPFIWVLNQSTRWLLRLVGIPYGSHNWYSRLTPEELQLIISTSTESPGLEADERELLTNVFEFREVTVGDVMVPRTQINALPKTATFHDLLAEIVASGHSRYPVVGESLDDICGIVYLKELVDPLARQALTPDSPLQQWIRPARFVPEYTPLHELLTLMQRTNQAMVMVVDEFGGTAGLVTLQDVIAEILGDLYEPEDDDDVLVRMLDDQTFSVKAQTNIEEVSELLNVSLPLEEDYHTLGGFLIYQMQKIPQAGDSLVYGGFEWIVTTVEGPRLHEVQVRRLDHEDDADTEVDTL
ncbi:Magnesium and cobalt efflux CorC domain protein [Halomicronema hongdechloris C2206]|uniref:Magnesium and cobalt efflux CorC domain protein n=1 Tax=Halomicronema hongdechloris C2206 TaxID=1641165 RepID=A0A1Z3HIV2_9CYAN|nr:hemolysin family protein [Halomicronema hongdechloris]ASC70228.1 Magnesium and cobalt efflux CorC domain protein [Halomicronema hongdechloris C2206]